MYLFVICLSFPRAHVPMFVEWVSECMPFQPTSKARSLCSRGPRDLKCFMHSHPLMVVDNQNFTQKIRRKKNVFCLISPTHYPAYNSCSKSPRGLKFVMRIDPPHADENCSFFSTFNKKQFLREFSLLRLITYVLRVLGVWNWLCVLTPLMWDRLPHFCFKIHRKLFIFFNFQKKTFF